MLPPLLEMRGIDKRFPGVHALIDVDLTLEPGEVLGFMGENGAGKSTLIKVLGGAHLPDRGTIRIEGRDTLLRNPVDARNAGVAVIYQEFNLVPHLTARENIFLGREDTRAGFISRDREHRQARDLFARIGVQVDPEALCRDLTIAQQQVVEIAKALSLNARIIVMDEPSATLTLQEVEHLFDMIRELRAQGMGIIYISHRLDEVFTICDRVMVMRDGAYVDCKPTPEVTRDELIEWMVGRKLENEFPARSSAVGEVRLRVEGLSRAPYVRDVSFTVRAGEILALTGLVGAGRTETVRLIFGADLPDAGAIELDGKPLRITHPRDAIRNGIGLLTEDRKGQGLVLGSTAQQNFGLPNLDQFVRSGFVRQGREADAFAGHIRSLRIKIPHRQVRTSSLSGGNQQKVVLAKWLQRNCEVIIFDEPTRGIDVGTKYEIYVLMDQLAAQGKAILMISSELPEVLGMADRIIGMHEGRVTGEILDVAKATQDQILGMAMR